MVRPDAKKPHVGERLVQIGACALLIGGLVFVGSQVKIAFDHSLLAPDGPTVENMSAVEPTSGADGVAELSRQHYEPLIAPIRGAIDRMFGSNGTP